MRVARGRRDLDPQYLKPIRLDSAWKQGSDGTALPALTSFE
jgi:hypothetical protein